MALSASIVLEVRTGGSDTNGGGFKTGATGTDWSLQNGTQYAVADGVTAGTTTITSATANFGTDVVGNLIYVQGGTGSITAGWYEIITRTNSTTIVVDRSTGLSAGTGATLNIGGALLSPGIAASIATVAGMVTFIKYNASAYSITSASTNIAGGCISGTNNTAYVGYDTTRSQYNTDANRPTLQLNASTATIMTNTNGSYYTQSLILDGNSQTTSIGYLTSGQAFNLKVINCTSKGMWDNNPGRAMLCEVASCSTAGNNPLKMSNLHTCIVHDCTMSANVAAMLANTLAANCISYNNTTGDGFGNGGYYLNCVAYGNGGAGFNAQNGIMDAANCIAENNTTYGFRNNASTSQTNLLNCASYNNTSGRSLASGGRLQDIGAITGSGSFFTNAAGLDFTLNNTSGAGALARAAGFPASYFGMSTYRDLGPLQHQDAANTSPVAKLNIFGRGAPY